MYDRGILGVGDTVDLANLRMAPVTDWNAVGQAFLNGGAWGMGFAIPFFVGITWAVLRILSHPTITKVARAADRISGKSEGWIVALINAGKELLQGGQQRQ